jgi:hypothetical protein
VVDPVVRSAARTAVLVAVPLAVLAGVAVFALLSGDRSEDPAPPASPSPTAVVATGPVAMPARELTERQELVCRALLARLPGQLDGQPQRPVTAGPEQNAAYGDPAVTLACGVPPVEVPPTADVLGMSGVCWYAVAGPDGSVWTTLDREVPVRVRVPAGYDGPGQQVIEFTDPILETVRPAGTAPTGCRR